MMKYSTPWNDVESIAVGLSGRTCSDAGNIKANSEQQEDDDSKGDPPGHYWRKHIKCSVSSYDKI